ncbi:MAG: hypothetical protein EPN92_13385 [Chitinophagaceae bacterium]|nr:MAG: hypothetical protein EPN92_13385 [Chitinophagaceae bacterium]
MKKILSERNFAAILFVLVFVAFSFAHEDSKKRDAYYNASYNSAPSAISSVAASAQPPEIEKHQKAEPAQH